MFYNSTKKRLITTILTLIMIILIPAASYGRDIYKTEPNYIYTAISNTSIVQDGYYVANASSNDGTLFTNISVSWEIKEGDSLEIRWYDRWQNRISMTSLDIDNTSVRNRAVSVPSGTYGAKLVLITGSATGNRYFWYATSDTTSGIHAIWPDPTIEPDPEDPPTEPPPSVGDEPVGGSVPTIVVDNSEMISLLQQLLVKLDGFSCICNNLQIISGKLDQLTLDINAHFGVIEGQLDQINDDMNTHFENIEEKFDDLNNYLMTPRQPDSYTNQDIPGVSFDPTPPEIEEDYAEPYVYDRPDPVVPDAIDSPPPLPTNPDPTIMEHDLPIAQDNPVSPAAPVTPTAPLQPDAANMDPPLAKTPVTMSAPLERDQVSMEQPITQNAPITKDSPATPDPAKARQAPLAPTPPIEPTPPE